MTATALIAEPTADLPEYAAGLFEPHRYKVLYGGRGAARSWSVARALLILAAERPLRVGCFREFQKSIKDSVHRLLTDQIDRLALPGYSITDREIRHVTGSLFLFEGLRHNVTKIKSLEGIDIAWVEEAERVSRPSWDVLIPTIRKAASEIWVTFNPDLEDDPTFQRFVVTPPPDSWVQKVSHADNPWFPPALEAERAYLYAVDPDAAAWVWGGECRKATGAQILRGKWTVEPFEPEPGWDGPYHGADFGFAQDPNALVKCWIAPGTIPNSTGRLMIEYEAWKVGQDTDAIPAAWMREVPGCEKYRIRADSARPETISYLQRHGFPDIVGVEKWQGSVEDGIAHLRQYEQIVIHPRCPHMADEARLYSYKVDPRTGDVLPDVVDAHNHCLVGETLVDTADGQFPISSLVGRAGIAFTLDGPRRFHSVRETSANEAVYRVRTTDGRSFTCTADHPIMTTDGWLPAVALRNGMHILTVDTNRYALESGCHPNTSRSTDDATAGTTRPATTRPTGAARLRRICTATYGKPRTALSRRASRCTTRTATSIRQTSVGLSASPDQRTHDCMGRNSRTTSERRCAETSSSAPCPLPLNGIAAPKVARGIPATPQIRLRGESMNAGASSAATPLREGALSARETFARMLASPRGDGRPASMTFDGNVLVVGAISPSIGTPPLPAVPGGARTPCATVDSVAFAGLAPVYNMEVDGAHHFTVEGGLVVHNCVDALRYALAPMIRHAAGTGVFDFYRDEAATATAARVARAQEMMRHGT